MPVVISESTEPRVLVEGALRRVATMAAHGADPDELFATIAVEALPVLGLLGLSLIVFDALNRSMSTVGASSGFATRPQVGVVTPIAGCRLTSAIARTDRPAAVAGGAGALLETTACCPAHAAPTIGAPIDVDGAIWGALVGHGEQRSEFTAGTQIDLADFADLMAAAISGQRRRDALRDLAEAQGALRRVATLVADDADPQTVFAAVASEAANVLHVGAVSLIRYEPQTKMFTKIFGTHGERAAVPDGGASPIENWPEGERILATGKPVRIDDWDQIPGPVAARHREQGFGQAVAAPIVLEGTIWGHIAAFGEADEILPEGCEARLADFTQLMASAIGNARARDELRALAAQQGAALRRVATLVAQRARPSAIFSAVAAEAGNALRVQRVDVVRRRPDGTIALVGSTEEDADPLGISARNQEVALRVLATSHTARFDCASTRACVVGAPILVDGSCWGVIVASGGSTLPQDTEPRLMDFTHLIASSIANMQARNEIIVSRARIVAASDEARRRIERNLHDGIQQRVVSLGLSLRLLRTQSGLSPNLHAGLEKVSQDLELVIEEVQVFSQGLHPALLSRAGLGPSLRALVGRSPIPVTLDVVGTRLPEPVETAVYYVVSEALANITKHAQASDVTVTVTADESNVRAQVVDDGVGGAGLGLGSGLTGLVDRVEALGGRFTMTSPAGAGTQISIRLPIEPPDLDDLPGEKA